MVKDPLDSGTLELPLGDEERQECEVWTRVMGYFRPKAFFNKGKVAEFEERKYFKESVANEYNTKPVK